MGVLVAFGSRSLILVGIAAGGQLRDWPGVGSLWSTFSSPWRYAMMGADMPAAPVFGLMTLLELVVPGRQRPRARTLVVAGALPLGAFGAYRLVRPLARSHSPVVATAVAYAINPIVRNAIAEGELGPLVCFALAPFVLHALMRPPTRRDRRARCTRSSRSACCCSSPAAVWPPALLLALFIVAGFALRRHSSVGRGRDGAHGDRRRRGTAAAALLLLPWLVTLVGADAATSASPRPLIDLADILAFDTGSARAGLVPVGLLVAAIVAARRSRPARGSCGRGGRGWWRCCRSCALGCRAGSTRQASVPAAEGILVPAALGLALAVGLGVARVPRGDAHVPLRLAAVRGRRRGRRARAPILAFAADTISGRWGLPTKDWPSQFAWMDGETRER